MNNPDKKTAYFALKSVEKHFSDEETKIQLIIKALLDLENIFTTNLEKKGKTYRINIGAKISQTTQEIGDKTNKAISDIKIMIGHVNNDRPNKYKKLDQINGLGWLETPLTDSKLNQVKKQSKVTFNTDINTVLEFEPEPEPNDTAIIYDVTDQEPITDDVKEKNLVDKKQEQKIKRSNSWKSMFSRSKN